MAPDILIGVLILIILIVPNDLLTNFYNQAMVMTKYHSLITKYHILEYCWQNNDWTWDWKYHWNIHCAPVGDVSCDMLPELMQEMRHGIDARLI